MAEIVGKNVKYEIQRNKVTSIVFVPMLRHSTFTLSGTVPLYFLSILPFLAVFYFNRENQILSAGFFSETKSLNTKHRPHFDTLLSNLVKCALIIS